MLPVQAWCADLHVGAYPEKGLEFYICVRSCCPYDCQHEPFA